VAVAFTLTELLFVAPADGAELGRSGVRQPGQQPCARLGKVSMPDYEPAMPSMNAPVWASMNATRYEGAFSAGSPGGGPAEGARKPGGGLRETAQASVLIGGTA
jgi:hypothetical protein